MRLGAIFCIWDDWGLLEIAVQNISQVADEIIIIASEKSNYGEVSPIPEAWKAMVDICEPPFKEARENETFKRNLGLQIALKRGCTHFITMDADELYDCRQVENAKLLFNNPSLNGLICPCDCFFASPTLTIGRDITLIPFIHKLTPQVRHGFNRNYFMAYVNRQIRIDPTRQLNIRFGIEYTEAVTMFHYSWVRPDYEKKIRNSTARANLEKSCILQDLVQAKENYFCEYYQRSLTRVENRFNIPEYGNHRIQST